MRIGWNTLLYAILYAGLTARECVMITERRYARGIRPSKSRWIRETRIGTLERLLDVRCKSEPLHQDKGKW